MTVQPEIPAHHKPLPQDAQYSASVDGRIWSIARQKYLRPRVTKAGYAVVHLPPKRTHYVHHLVASAWHGIRPSSNHVIDHLDENKLNNSVANLEWVTRKENSQRASRSGTLNTRRRGNAAVLSDDQVIRLREGYANGTLSLAQGAKLLGVDDGTVRNAVTGRTYKHVGGPISPHVRSQRRKTGGGQRKGPAQATDLSPEAFITTEPGELWQRLPDDLDGYWVSSHGRVFSAKTRRILRPSVTRQGYLRVHLRAHGGAKNKMVHVLVATAFVAKPAVDREDLVVGHINGVPADPRAANLSWISRRENALMALSESV